MFAEMKSLLWLHLRIGVFAVAGVLVAGVEVAVVALVRQGVVELVDGAVLREWLSQKSQGSWLMLRIESALLSSREECTPAERTS